MQTNGTIRTTPPQEYFWPQRFVASKLAHSCSLIHYGSAVYAASMRVRSSADLESPSSFAKMHMIGTLYKHSVRSDEKTSLLQFDVETHVDAKCFDQVGPQCRNKQHKAEGQQVILSVHWKERQDSGSLSSYALALTFLQSIQGKCQPLQSLCLGPSILQSWVRQGTAGWTPGRRRKTAVLQRASKNRPLKIWNTSDLPLRKMTSEMFNHCRKSLQLCITFWKYSAFLLPHF